MHGLMLQGYGQICSVDLTPADSHAHAQQVVEGRPVHGGVGDPLDQRGSVHGDSLCYV